MAAREVSGWTYGFVVFAGVMLMLVGSFHAFTGLAAIFENEFFVVGPNYAYELDVTAWGWLHLIFGVIVVAAGFGVFNGATWARVVGITLAIFSAIGELLLHPVPARLGDPDHRARRARDRGSLGVRAAGRPDRRVGSSRAGSSTSGTRPS